MRVKMENLTKQFGTLTAVDHFNVEMEDGELIALLGPVRLRKEHDSEHARRHPAGDGRKNLV